MFKIPKLRRLWHCLRNASLLLFRLNYIRVASQWIDDSPLQLHLIDGQTKTTNKFGMPTQPKIVYRNSHQCCYFSKNTTVKFQCFQSFRDTIETNHCTQTKLFIPWLFRSTAKTYYCSDAYQIVVSNWNVYIFKRQRDKINDCPSNTCTFWRRNYAILFRRSLSRNYFFIIEPVDTRLLALHRKMFSVYLIEFDLQILKQEGTSSLQWKQYISWSINGLFRRLSNFWWNIEIW